MALLKRWWKWALAALALGLTGFLLLRPEPLGVEVEAVQRRDLSVTVEEQGRTRARNPYVVAAPVAGRLMRVELEEGDRVEEGAVLARLAVAPENSRTLAILRAGLTAAEARLAAARATLAEAEGALALARREEERREELFKTNVVSAEERETYRQMRASAEARLRSARAAEQAAVAEAESARARLLGLDDDGGSVEEVRAPVSGVVHRVLEESERVVPAGVPLLEISGDENLEVVVDLLTQDAVRVSPGDTLLISGWGGDDVIEGRVKYVEPRAFTKVSALGVEEQRVNVVGEMLDPPPALGAEYRVEAAIVVWRGEDVLSVPVSALFQRGGGWRVFAVGADGEVELRALEIGRRGRNHAQVLGGLEEGEAVILFPSDLVTEGSRVSY